MLWGMIFSDGEVHVSTPVGMISMSSIRWDVAETGGFDSEYWHETGWGYTAEDDAASTLREGNDGK